MAMRRVLCCVLIIALGEAAVRYPRGYSAGGGFEYGDKDANSANIEYNHEAFHELQESHPGQKGLNSDISDGIGIKESENHKVDFGKGSYEDDKSKKDAVSKLIVAVVGGINAKHKNNKFHGGHHYSHEHDHDNSGENFGDSNSGSWEDGHDESGESFENSAKIEKKFKRSSHYRHEHDHSHENSHSSSSSSSSEESGESWEKVKIKRKGEIKGYVKGHRTRRSSGYRYGNRGYRYNSGESFENSHENGERFNYNRHFPNIRGGFIERSSEESNERYY